MVNLFTNTFRIRFLGAAETVTGSKYLLINDKINVLVDCGLFQGLKELRLKNWDRFPIDPKLIDAIVLTHAHIDHSGYIPRLIKEGFKGKIFCTSATLALCRILLPDFGYLQEAAPNVFGGVVWRLSSSSSRPATQKAIYHVQVDLENLVIEEPKWLFKRANLTKKSRKLGQDILNIKLLLALKI